MSVEFYDKDDIEIEKQVQSLNERLDSIRRAYPKEVKYIYQGRKVFNDYDNKVRERMVDLFLESQWMRVGTVVGTAVGILATWELYRGIKLVLRWAANKIAQRDHVEVTRSRRTHARNWINE